MIHPDPRIQKLHGIQLIQVIGAIQGDTRGWGYCGESADPSDWVGVDAADPDDLDGSGDLRY